MRVARRPKRLTTLLLAGATFCLASCTSDGGDTGATAATSDASDLQQRAREIHDRVLVLDAHADIEIPGQPSRYAGADGLSKVAPEKMKAGGMDAVVMAVAVGPGPRTPEGYAAARETADQELAAVQQLVGDASNEAVLALTADAVEAAHAEGQRALLLGFQNALILGKDVDGIDSLYADGVRVFALTHMGHNDFADSSRPLFVGETGSYEPEAEHGGLSDLGRAAIRKLNELGVVVDVSQLSKPATLEVLELSRAPVIASHSNVKALCDVRRNLSDEELDLIAENGGVVHVAAFRGYLFDSNDEKLDSDIRAARREVGLPEDYDYPFELYWELDDPEVQQSYIGAISNLLGPGSVDAMLDHVDYIVQRVGVDHVGIGNDFNHGSGIEGFDDASESFNVTLALLERGYSEEDIAKIWGGNFLRVMRAAEAAATAN